MDTEHSQLPVLVHSQLPVLEVKHKDTIKN
jgi:hypothetical protein